MLNLICNYFFLLQILVYIGIVNLLEEEKILHHEYNMAAVAICYCTHAVLLSTLVIGTHKVLNSLNTALKSFTVLFGE